ncbi:methyltransferase fkbm family [Micractinium conductrix]|uniref:Methyltransferase fkbm family n=1 Tax=Micractinium conductrix TaxID=554055 RepID=A0A2P6UZM3_9CHLO|nr:methyltransferase fkbm family [Micractinium conductrix]|eukprot:PSC67279.1 methyltransferase fkbm family [Micractinium conductrix]
MYNNFFYGKAGGFFLEMGGADGLQHTNTYWLSRAAGWHGMLIEADPESYKRMVVNRPDTINVNAAVCDEFKVVHHVALPPPNNEMGGIWEVMSEQFKRRWNITVDDVNSLPTIPCVPLGELMVLQTFDFSRVRVKTMVVEASGLDKEKDAAVQVLLEKNGFTMVYHHDFNQATAFCKKVEYMSQRYDPKALIYVNEKDEPYRLRLKPEKLLTAAYEFQKVQNEMESLPRLQVDLPHLHNDPIAGCPVCARTFRAETNSGEEAEEEEAAAAVAAGSAPTCATQLHCSRTTAGAHAKLDYHGIVGLVCMHIIPLLGLFLAMPTYEQHYYYDVLFESLLTRRPDVAFLYLDLACRYIGRFNRLLAKLPESSRNKFAGARVGEQTEQLWSLTKKFCKLARYMSRMRWIDGFNFLLQQYTKALADLVAAAARQGINNLPAMAEEEAAPVAQRLLLGPKATDQKKRLRLEAEKNKAAIDAGLGVTERDWEPGSATYEEGLRELRVSKLTHYERQIEETVFERRLVLQRMEQTGGDKNGAQDRKKAEQLRKRVPVGQRSQPDCS